MSYGNQKLAWSLWPFQKCVHALDLGLICQPAKTSPPGPIQKFCGFVYDTTGIPERTVPVNKTSRALALLSFV
jgi:hypothetical protein